MTTAMLVRYPFRSHFRISLFWLFLVFGLQTEVIAQTHSKQKKTETPSEKMRFEKQTPEQIQKTMDVHGRNFLKNPGIHSVSIGIFKDGMDYSGHYGELEKGKLNIPNDKTLYSIASITKTMTGTLAAQAVVDGKIKLGDDVRKYLEGQYPNLEYSGSPIRIRHLLTHMSGLPTDPPGYDRMFQKWDFTMPYPKESFFADLKEAKIDAVPGTKYNYSGFGTILISYVLENVYKTTFDALLDKFILSKAGMTNTKLKMSPKEREQLVLGHRNGKTAIDLPLHLTGAEGMVKSTVADLLKYIKFQLNDALPLVRESRKKLHEERWMGYFWQIWDDGDVLFYQHSGNAPGTTSWLLIYPKYKMGICVITNTRMKGLNDLMYYGVVANLLDELRPSGKSIAKAIDRQQFSSADQVVTFYRQLKRNARKTYLFSDVNGLSSIGIRFLKEEKATDAIEIFKLLVAEFPDTAKAYHRLGEAYFAAGENDKALNAINRSLRLNPNNKNAKLFLEQIGG